MLAYVIVSSLIALASDPSATDPALVLTTSVELSIREKLHDLQNREHGESTSSGALINIYKRTLMAG